MCSTCDCKVEPIVNGPVHVKRCRKCNSEPYIVLNKVHVECQKCFLESCNRKIRSTIGKSKLLRNNDKILIAWSGGPSSTALVDLIKNSMEFEARREQKFRPSIVHIDMQSAFDEDFQHLKSTRLAKLLDKLHHLRAMCSDWPIYWTTLESWHRFEPMLYTTSDSVNHDSLLDEVSFRGFRDQIDLCDNLTAKQDFVQSQLETILKETPCKISCHQKEVDDKFKFVLVGSSTTRLANELLVNVIEGRASNLKAKVAIHDETSTGQEEHSHSTPIMRPMRDFSMKEIMFYVRARDIEESCSVVANLITFADRKSSIQTLAESFLSKLQLDYPSTCNTLLRTGNKMKQ